MYTSVRNTPDSLPRPTLKRTARVSFNVVLLGVTSLLTDLSQEMVTSILPLYLTFQLRLSPLMFGVVDGIYQGASALVRLIGGVIADRRGRYKEVAATGYGVSAATKAGLLVMGGAWLPVTGLLFIDRIGKGIRTGPRDALISLSSEAADLGTSFGVHRALDTFGALLGPLCAFVILTAIPFGYDAIFAVSFCVALIGLAVLLLFVRNKGTNVPAEARRSVSWRRAIALLREPSFRRIAVIGSVFGLLTIGDGFIYLILQRTASIDPTWFPLFFLGTAAAYLVLAIPLGKLADRIGRHQVFIGGYVALLAVYLVLLSAAPAGALVAMSLLLLGTYYAATDGVLMALTTPTLAEAIRTSGLALVSTMVSLARFAASIGFGAMWVVWGPRSPIMLFAVALAASLPIAWRTLRWSG